MTSIPASRSARAITLAPRSCPSRPGFATSTRIFRSPIDLHLTTPRTEAHGYRGSDCKTLMRGRFESAIRNLKSLFYMVLISRLRHKYQHATERYGSQDFAIFVMTSGLGILRFL